LFWAACRLAENGVPPSDALDVLTAAAGQAGLGEREIVTTVRSAYRIAHPTPATGSLGRGGDAWFERANAPNPGLGGRRL
jgi:hypothetical protein